MAKIGMVENGFKKRRTKRRRNPMAVAKASSKNPARRINPKKRRRSKRRNGLMTATVTRRNGLFGDTKRDAKNVAALGGGLFLTKFIGNMVSGYVQPLLARIGLGQYSQIVTNAGIALIAIPMIAKRTVPKQSDMLRLGGLFATGLSILEQVAPSVLTQINPFNNTPVVIANGAAAVPPATVAQIAQGVAASSNPMAAANRVGSVMQTLDTVGARGFTNDFMGSVNDPQLVL